MVSGKKKSRSSVPSESRRTKTTAVVCFALCVKGTDFDLIKGKAYRVLRDAKGTKLGYTRVIDDSGEDYLYPSLWFVPIRITRTSQRLVEQALRTSRAFGE